MDRIHVMELVRSFQVGEIDRRTFLKRTTAAIGSLAAANTLLAACAAFPNEEAPRSSTSRSRRLRPAWKLKAI